MRRIIQIALLVSVSTILALGGSELAVRIAGIDPNTNPRLRFEPTLGWTLDPTWEPIDEVRPDGFRYAAPAAAGGERRRLVVLGDSFVVGGQLPFRKTFVGLLTEWLDGATGPSDGAADDLWEVRSLAASGWGTGQQLIALRDRGLDPPPDAVVLVVFPYNDLCNNNIEQAFTCSVLDFHRPYFVIDGDSVRVTSLHPTRAALRRFSRLFAVAEVGLRWGFPAPRETSDMKRKDRLRARRDVLREQSRRVGLTFDSNLHSLLPEPEQPPVIRAGWEITQRLITEMAAELDGLHVPLISVVVPYADTFQPDWVEDHRTKGRPIQPDHATHTIEAMLAEVDVPVISVRRRISASEHRPAAFFHPRGRQGDRHLSSYGHWWVATWIVDEMRTLGLTDRPAPPAPLDLTNQ